MWRGYNVELYGLMVVTRQQEVNGLSFVGDLGQQSTIEGIHLQGRGERFLGNFSLLS